jgi:hypothetical protein
VSGAGEQEEQQTSMQGLGATLPKDGLRDDRMHLGFLGSATTSMMVMSNICC